MLQVSKVFVFVFFCFIHVFIPLNLEWFLVLLNAQINIQCRNEFFELYIYLRINWKTLEKQIVLFHPPQKNVLYSKVFIEHTMIIKPKKDIKAKTPLQLCISNSQHFCIL